jgi:hypothetical protein
MTAPEPPPPLVLTGDELTDEALAMLRATTEGIHKAQEQAIELSAERRRIVLDLREQRGVKFSKIAEAAGSTEQTIYKVHREAKDERRDLAHGRGDHRYCDDPAACRAAQPEQIEGQLDLDDAGEPVALAG